VNRRASQNKRSGQPSNIDKVIFNSHKGAANAFRMTCLSDLHLRPPVQGITQSPPLNYRDSVFWCDDSVDLSTNYTSGGTVFNASTFQLTDCFTLPLFAALFDQYCIYDVKVRFMFEFTNSGASPGEFLSAIDFDSATVPTGPGALENYSSFEVMPITQGACQERFVKPCVTPFVFQSGVSVTSFTVARQWIDSADTSVPHFGIKYGIRGNTQAVIGKTYLTYTVGFRNKL
jgi:hypothetical protein